MEPIRVTEVLNYFKEPWYIDWVCRVGKAEANRTGKRAMKIGSRVDELIKNGDKPKAKDVDEIKTCYLAFEKWRAVYKPKAVVNGERLYAEICGVPVTGEPDIFVDDVLVDIKCASKISKQYWVQVNMYRYLQGAVGKVGVLRLDKLTGSYEYVIKDYDASLVQCWIGLLKAYLYFREENDKQESA